MKTISNLKVHYFLFAMLVMLSCNHKNYSSVDELVKDASNEIAQLKPDSILGIKKRPYIYILQKR